MMKLIVFDLDNTLAPVGKGIRPETINMLKEIEKTGIQIAICSGKPTFYTCGLMRQTGLEDPILIGENGAVIQFGVDLPPKKYEVQKYSKEAKETICFLRQKIEEVMPHVWFQPNEVGLTPFLTKQEEFDTVNKILEDYKDQVNDVIVYEQADCFDITPNGITKKSGIENLAKILDVRPEEIIAVGDGINDYPMFEFAGTSFGVNVKDEDKVDINFASITDVLKHIWDICQKNDTTCTLCPRECKVNRKDGKPGFCGVNGEGVYLARAALHMWEEPCISGEEGSGTVFFSGCPLRCVYCQNYNIANAKTGKEVTKERLSEIFLELQEKGANNINLVTPTHYTPEIVWAVKKARENGLRLPIVYNCSGYEKVETLKMLDGIVDIYLTDFKYMDKEAAKRYSNAADYPEVAKKALEEMVRQTGEARFSQKGIMKKGVIVRHLLLPGYMKNAKAVVQYVYETYGDRVFLSLMNQYTPLPQVVKFPEINRCVTEEEYDELVDFAIETGVENGFIQEGETAKESFIPEFNNEGV